MADGKFVSFKISKDDAALVRKIGKRARALGFKRRLSDIEMDLTACHANGTPMDFARLLEADDFNLMHDVTGIPRHLDFETGKLLHHFLPRFRARVAA